MPAFFLAALSSPWVQKILFPALSYIFLKFEERYRSDPAFKERVDGAADLLKNAKTTEERQNAARAYQDALFR